MTAEQLIGWCDMLKYKVGDEVFVRPYEEIAAQFKPGSDILPSGCHFPLAMMECCGNSYRVRRVNIRPDKQVRYTLDGEDRWVFTDEMLSLNELQLPELHMSFDDLFE